MRLFRPEAVAFQREPLRSSEALPRPPAAAAFTWLLVALVGVGAIFLAQGHYARKVTVPGFLVPTVGVAKVFPPQAGLVIALDVHEGQLVDQGAPLLTVRVGQTDSRGDDVEGAVL